MFGIERPRRFWRRSRFGVTNVTDCTNTSRLDCARGHTGGSRWKWLWSVVILPAMLVAGIAQADTLSSVALVQALRQGGYILLMRHASSPAAPPTTESAERDNTRLERQLDQTGRNAAHSMGAAIKTSWRGLVEPHLSRAGDGAPRQPSEPADSSRAE